MAHEPMTAADAVFLRIETDHEPQHVGSLSLFEGGPLRSPDGAIRIDELRAHVERRLDRVPRLRQRVREIPLSQGRPVWVDDEHFDIEYHVRLTSLPRPGGRAEVLALMDRVQAIPLDRDRPLWEMWFVDGLADDRVGMVLKTHHALGDGIANVDLALALVDLERDPPPDDPLPDDLEPWTPRPATPRPDLLVDAVVHQLTRPLALAGRALDSIRDPRPTLRGVADVAKTISDFLVRPAPAPWNRPIGAQRRWVSATVPLAEVRRVRERHAVTINDIVLAACSGALRAFLGAHDVERPADTPLRAMVPVSLRTDDEHGETLGNRISLILVDLPVSVTDPIERLDAVHEQTSRLKGSSMVDGAQIILDLADGIPQIARPVTSFVSRRIPMNLVVTNVPGPPIPLYLRGARLEEVFPYVEVIDNEGLTIAVVSYDDQLFFGITADRDVLADVGDLATAIEREFGVLAAAG